MIIRVWGVVNSAEVEFTPIPDRPGYWEGTAPRMPGLQDIEIWAESSTGAHGHLQCTVMLDYHAHTEAWLLGDQIEASLIDAEDKVRMLLLPWVAQLVALRAVDLLPETYSACLKGCRKAVR